MERQLTGYWSRAIKAITVLFAVFLLYTAAFGAFPHMQQRALFVVFSLLFVLCTQKATKRPQGKSVIPWWDLILIAIVVVAGLNIFFRYEYYIYHGFGVQGLFEYIVGAALIVIILELGRRSMGWVFPILTSVALAYCFLGPWIPGHFGHPGFQWQHILQVLYQSDRGIWSGIVGLGASVVAMFIMFGAILQCTGGGKTFIDLALIIAGRFRGGAAVVAVIASAFFGMLSGSAVANTATTGNFTIPLMKKTGYSPEFAAGVEAAASTGGNIMPPVLGMAAFVMAEWLGVSYLTICLAALIPACLFFISLAVGVRLQAAKLGLAPVAREVMPRLREVVTWGRLAPLLIPIAILIFFLVEGYSPFRCAFYAVVAAVVLYMCKDFSPSGWIQRLKDIGTAISRGVRLIATFAPLIICAQIFITLMQLTGFGNKFSSVVMGIGEGNILLVLIVTAFIALIFGMGMPTTAAYIVASSLSAPALILLGLDPLSSHLFIFVYAIISAFTPPVCITVFVAALIAEVSWLKAAWWAIRLAPVAYVMPFLYIYRPAFLLRGEPLEIVLAVCTAVAGIFLLSSGVIGYMNNRLHPVVRITFILGGIMFFIPGGVTDIIGVISTVGGFITLYLLLPRIRRKGAAHK